MADGGILFNPGDGGYVSPDAITSFIREIPTPAEYQLENILPDRFFKTNKVDWANLTRRNRTARYRAFDGRIHSSSRDIGGGGTVQLPPLSSSMNVGELESLELAFAATGGTNIAALAEQIYDDAASLTREVQARKEQARGDVLVDGKFTLAGEGNLFMEANYSVPANHFVAPGILWSSPATATVVANLQAWTATYVATNGFAPGGMIMSQTVFQYLLSNTEFRTLLSTLTGTPGLVTPDAVATIFSKYGLPPIRLIYDAQVDVDNVATRVMPASKVIFLPPDPSSLGFFAMGVTATALELVGSKRAELSFEQAPGIVGVVIKTGPPFRKTTFVDAVGMPVLSDANRLMVATVI